MLDAGTHIELAFQSVGGLYKTITDCLEKKSVFAGLISAEVFDSKIDAPVQVAYLLGPTVRGFESYESFKDNYVRASESLVRMVLQKFDEAARRFLNLNHIERIIGSNHSIGSLCSALPRHNLLTVVASPRLAGYFGEDYPVVLDQHPARFKDPGGKERVPRTVVKKDDNGMVWESESPEYAAAPYESVLFVRRGSVFRRVPDSLVERWGMSERPHLAFGDLWFKYKVDLRSDISGNEGNHMASLHPDFGVKHHPGIKRLIMPVRL